MDNGGSLNNGSGSTINNESGGQIGNTGIVNNGGSLSNGGSINNTGGTFDNTSGTIEDDGGTVSGTLTGNQPVASGSNSIDITSLSGTLTITSTGYKIGNVEYAQSGMLTISGNNQGVNIIIDCGAGNPLARSGNRAITMNNVDGGDITVTGNSAVDVYLVGDSEVETLNVENGSTFNTSGSGTIIVRTKLTNEGTVNNNSNSTIQNDGTAENNGTINNNGEIKNNGTLKNNGTMNNNNGGFIDTTGGNFDNTNGSVKDNGGNVTGTITGNQPTTGGGTGGTGSSGTSAGEAKNSWWIQAGSEAGQGINIQIGAMNTKVLGIEKDTVNILTQESSGNAITAVSQAIEKLSEQRSRLGAYQNRLENTIRNLDNVVENTTAAESQIRDADMAKLMVEHSNNNIIMQAAQAMLAQANHQPDGILQLLQ